MIATNARSTRKRLEPLRGMYKRSFRPDVGECERRIIDDWFDLCTELQSSTPDSIYVAVKIRRLHDWQVFRTRAARREAKAGRAA